MAITSDLEKESCRYRLAWAAKKHVGVTDAARRQIERANQTVGNPAEGKIKKKMIVMMQRERRLSAPQTAAARDTKKQLERLGHLAGRTIGQCFWKKRVE